MSNVHLAGSITTDGTFLFVYHKVSTLPLSALPKNVRVTSAMIHAVPFFIFNTFHIDLSTPESLLFSVAEHGVFVLV